MDLREAAQKVIEAFEALGNPRDVASTLVIQKRCEKALIELKEALAL